MNAHHFDFEFPAPSFDPSSSSALPNDVVFCGKVIHRQSEPHPPQEVNNSFLLRSHSLVKSDTGRSDGLLKPLAVENRCRRSASSRKYRNGLFGILKFPVEMDLSEIKSRQGRREPAPLPKFPENDNGDWVSGGDGGNSCWEMARPLKRRGPLVSALVRATFGCIPPL